MYKTDDHNYRNTSEDLYFEITNTDILSRNSTNSLWFCNLTTENKYINTTEPLYFRSRLVDRDVPQFQIILDLFDYFGGIY